MNRHLCNAILAICALLCVQPSAQGESIHGIVTFEKVSSFLGSTVDEIHIRPLVGRHLTRQKGLPIETTLIIRESLSTLQAGDFVVLSGQYVDSDKNGSMDFIFVNGIESVGLKRLIRAWKSDRWDIMKFESFDKIILYRPTTTMPRLGRRPTDTLRLKKLKELNYTLAPETGSDFSILMVERADMNASSNPVFAGRLSVEKENLKIELFDTKSGQTAEVYSLSPL